MSSIVTVNGSKIKIQHTGEILYAVCTNLHINCVHGYWVTSRDAVIEAEDGIYAVHLVRHCKRE